MEQAKLSELLSFVSEIWSTLTRLTVGSVVGGFQRSGLEEGRGTNKGVCVVRRESQMYTSFVSNRLKL